MIDRDQVARAVAGLSAMFQGDGAALQLTALDEQLGTVELTLALHLWPAWDWTVAERTERLERAGAAVTSWRRAEGATHTLDAGWRHGHAAGAGPAHGGHGPVIDRGAGRCRRAHS